MNVGELRRWLEQYPDDLLVVVASDEEGNDFHRAYDLAHGFFTDDIDREFHTTALDDEAADDWTERELTLDECNAICIWP